MYAWPSTKLPLPSINFSNKAKTSVIRTQMDTGASRQRQRFTSGVRTVAAQWKLTDDEFALFQGVFKYKLSNGADWFTISLPLGSGFKTYTIRFTDDGWSAAYDNYMHWNVTANMEAENTSALTESETNTALS